MRYDQELQILKKSDHPFVIKYQDMFEYKGLEGKSQLCIINQLATLGDLAKLMKQKMILSEDEGMHYFTMILIGLHYLHS